MPDTIMTMDETDKLHKSVIIGDVNGKISEVFTKVNTLHAKQQFAFGIIAGELFGSHPDEVEVDKLLGGQISIQVPLYFTLRKQALPSRVVDRLESSDGELCPNLTAFGRRGAVKTTEGFKIAAIGGAHAQTTDEPMSLYSATYNDKDIEILKSQSDVDLFITSDWPEAITDGSQVKYNGQLPTGTKSIADLCSALKPRYHFSASDHVYEREPFFHNGAPPRTITRFISLAPYGNAGKEKWIYAFQLQPSSSPPDALPNGCTASPLTSSNKKRKLESSSDSNNFRYASDPSSTYTRNGGGPRGKRQRNNHFPPPTPEICYFCISRPNCETHLITSIATSAYLTTAKGPLPTSTTYTPHNLPFPCHMLIIPMSHAPTLSSIPDTDERESTLLEMQQYRSALHSMLASKAEGQLGAVTWEISRGGGVHLHWQFMPVPLEKIGLVETAFDVEAENYHYARFVKTSHDIKQAEEEGDFLRVMIWSPPSTTSNGNGSTVGSKGQEKQILLPIPTGARFDLQFARRTLAKLLGLEGRVQWRDNAQSMEEEKKDAEAFKEAFGVFDFA